MADAVFLQLSRALRQVANDLSPMVRGDDELLDLLNAIEVGADLLEERSFSAVEGLAPCPVAGCGRHDDHTGACGPANPEGSGQ